MADVEEWVAFHRGLAIALGKDPVEAEQAVMAAQVEIEKNRSERARLMQVNERADRITFLGGLGGLFLLWVAGITLLFFLFQ